MMDSLADIETLALRCRSERAREYIGEAILCYRAGAYRSAIVNTWIAVVFDLVDKVRELALAADPAARAINAQYETYIAQINAGSDQGVKNALEFERLIVSTCKDKLQFFDHQQLRDLERLREDRHQCAHPSFQKVGEPYRPAAEQARLHLRMAIEHVLSRPPVQGRSAILELETIIASEYFPKDRLQASTVLRGTALTNANEALIRGFIDSMVFGYTEPTSRIFGKAQVGFALAALLDLHRAPTENRLSLQLSKIVRDIDDPGLPSVAQLVVDTEEGIFLISQAARIRLIEFVRSGPFAQVGRVFAGLSRHPEIEPIADARILASDGDELADVIGSGARLDVVKQRALTLLSEATNFNAVNGVFRRLIMPIFPLLSREDVERVVRMPTETHADLIGATGYSPFIQHVRGSGLIPQLELDALLRGNSAAYLAPEPAVND
ncbi:hypothetical protein D3C71_929110 [compost metagenome]